MRRTSIKISVRKSTKTFLGKNPQMVYMPVKVVCHEVFYCVSGIINYNFDLSVSAFPISVVKMNHNTIFFTGAPGTTGANGTEQPGGNVPAHTLSGPVVAASKKHTQLLGRAAAVFLNQQHL